MDHANETLSQELVAMAKNDLSVREALVADGSLGHALYNPRMEAVHIANAAHLIAIIDEYGWPGNRLVGEEGAWAAWLIAQHAIGNPPFMRHCLTLLKQAAANKDVMPWQPAFLEDRIRMYEGKPQIYGTQFQPNKNGLLEPYPIEDSESVNERRQAVGLNTIEERTAELTAQNARENIPAPPDLDEQYQQWLYAVGWRGAS
ncbi:DUF6624 domain-containing protein [Methylomonas sp. UP202]|uniref:DUF6624 domain-containing protein n=1 Tax=Methylomonas sp. UP202 TaxID=3040943 RepID=UPI0024790FFE|nr:DUF6624 domain-containing protein [Methylomonas sp. UP202]WGS83982.1 hypothetical protein QC632_13055 [Methylomonas sp. UP202]